MDMFNPPLELDYEYDLGAKPMMAESAISNGMTLSMCTYNRERYRFLHRKVIRKFAFRKPVETHSRIIFNEEETNFIFGIKSGCAAESVVLLNNGEPEHLDLASDFSGKEIVESESEVVMKNDLLVGVNENFTDDVEVVVNTDVQSEVVVSIDESNRLDGPSETSSLADSMSLGDMDLEEEFELPDETQGSEASSESDNSSENECCENSYAISSKLSPQIVLGRLTDSEIKKYTQSSGSDKSIDKSDESTNIADQNSPTDKPLAPETPTRPWTSSLNSFQNYKIPKYSKSKQRRDLTTDDGKTISSNSIGTASTDDGYVLELHSNPQELELDGSTVDKCETHAASLNVSPDILSVTSGKISEPTKSIGTVNNIRRMPILANNVKNHVADDTLSIMADSEMTDSFSKIAVPSCIVSDADKLFKCVDSPSYADKRPTSTVSSKEASVAPTTNEAVAPLEDLVSVDGLTKSELKSLQYGYCHKILNSQTCRFYNCSYCHVPLEDSRLTHLDCMRFFNKKLIAKQYDLAEKIFTGCKFRTELETAKKMAQKLIDVYMKKGNLYSVAKLWKHFDDLNVNVKVLEDACHRLVKPRELCQLMLYLQSKSHWPSFWKLVECTLEKDYSVYDSIVCKALDRLWDYVEYVPIAVQLLLCLTPDTCHQIGLKRWSHFMRNLENLGDQDDFLRKLRRKLQDWIDAFPQMFAPFVNIAQGVTASATDFIAPDSTRESNEHLMLANDIMAPPTVGCEPRPPMNNHVPSVPPPVCMATLIPKLIKLTKQKLVVHPLIKENHFPVKELKRLAKHERWTVLMNIFICRISTMKSRDWLNRWAMVFITDMKRIGDKFSKFIQTLECVDESILLGARRYMSQLGVLLFMHCHKLRQFEPAYRLLVELHLAGINYLELTQNENHERGLVSRCQVALAAVDACMRVRKFESALTILQASNWAVPCCEDVLHAEDRLRRCQLLSKVIQHLLKDEIPHVVEARDILISLYASHKIDYAQLKADYLLHTDLGNLTDLLITVCINSLNDAGNENKNVALEVAFEVYQKAHDCFFSLEPSSLRALFILAMRNDLPFFCQDIFSTCCCTGIYPQLHAITWPWCISIYSYLTGEEISYIMKTYLKNLSNILLGPKNSDSVDRDTQTLHINLEVMSFVGTFRVWLLEEDSTLEAIKNRVIVFAKQELSPPLDVLSRGDNRIMEVTPISLRNHLASLGVPANLYKQLPHYPEEEEKEVATSNQPWSCFMKPKLHSSGYDNPFKRMLAENGFS